MPTVFAAVAGWRVAAPIHGAAAHVAAWDLPAGIVQVFAVNVTRRNLGLRPSN